MAKTTVRELANKYLKSLENIRSLSGQTIRAYSSDLLQIFQGGWEAPLPSEPRALRTLILGGLSNMGDLEPSSRARKVATAKGFARWLFDQKAISVDISAQLRGPKVNPKLPTFLSLDEAMSLLKTLEDHAPWEERTLLLLMYGGGLRVSEACAVEWSQLDWNKNTLRVVGKGNKERLIALPVRLMDLLGARRKTKGPVFDPPITTRKAYDLVRAWGARAGIIKSVHPHALRHSYATHLLTSGADLRVLQELLGHSSLTATQKYTHINIDQLARTLEAHHPLGKK